MAITAHFSITIIIHIIHFIIIFLFQLASINLIAYFPLKNMGVYFLHYWPAFRFATCLQVTATSFVVSSHVDNREVIQMCTKKHFKEHLLHYQLSKLS